MMNSYTAQTPIHYDGSRYAVGDSIDLSTVDAAALLRVGAIAPDEQAAEAEPAAQAAPSGKQAKARTKGSLR